MCWVLAFVTVRELTHGQNWHMALKPQIQEDAKNALKAGEALRVSTLRMLLSAITNREVEKKKKEEGLPDEEIIEVISTEIKKRKEAASKYREALFASNTIYLDYHFYF